MLHLLVCVALCSGLSGICVGLGAMMPNMRQQSPSADCRRLWRHAHAGAEHGVYCPHRAFDRGSLPFLLAMLDSPTLHRALDERPLELWLALALPAAWPPASSATIVPLWLGARSFRKLEF